MPFAILRFEKHKTFASLRSASAHMERSRETLNADLTRRSANEVVVGAELSPVEAAEARIKKHTIDVGKPMRANGVLAIEVLMAASPQFFATASPAEKAAWERQSQEWLDETFGRENVVSLTAHRDERSPHLTGLVVPVDPDTGRLNARRWLGGPQKLRDLQTSYAATVTDLGLSRGIEGSTAKHQTVRSFYKSLSTEVGKVIVPAVAVPPFSMSTQAREDWAAQETIRLQAAIAPQAADLAMKARAGLSTAKRAKTLQDDMTEAQKVATSVRELPLTDVLKELGLNPDPKDQTGKQFTDAEGRFRITTNGRTFHDHASMTNGKGAIDLAKHVLESDYKEAVAWLADRLGPEAATRNVAAQALDTAPAEVAAIQRTTAPFRLPTIEPDRKLIHTLLSGEYKMNRDLVDSFIDDRRIVSDARQNVGFVMVDEHGRPQGMELRGTGGSDFVGLAPGSSRDATFRIEPKSRVDTPKRRVVLVSNALDALSYVHMAEDTGPTIIASTAGSRSTLPESLRKAVSSATDVIVGFFNSTNGNNAAARLLENLHTWWKGRRARQRPRSRSFSGDLRGDAPIPDLSRGPGRG